MNKLFKNISNLLVLSAIIVLASCGKDEEVVLPDGPTITIVSDQLSPTASYDGTVGDVISFAVTINAPGGFNTLNITGLATPVSLSKASGTTELTRTTDTYTLNALTEAEVGATGSIVIMAVDDNNKTSSVTVEFTVKSAPITPFSAFMLPVVVGDLSNKSFFSTNTGMQYSPSEVVASADPLSNDIDFGYYYGTTNFATIASPAGFEGSVFSAQVANWGTKNSTTLLATTMTAAQFTETTTQAALETAFAAGTDGGEFRTALEVGNVIAFQTNSTKTNSPGKKGLILIKAINGTTDSDANIEIEVLVEK